MNWAQQRKLGYIAIVVAFFAIVAFVIIHKATEVIPTCFDNKKMVLKRVLIAVEYATPIVKTNSGILLLNG